MQRQRGVIVSFQVINKLSFCSAIKGAKIVFQLFGYPPLRVGKVDEKLQNDFGVLTCNVVVRCNF